MVAGQGPQRRLGGISVSELQTNDGGRVGSLSTKDGKSAPKGSGTRRVLPRGYRFSGRAPRWVLVCFAPPDSSGSLRGCRGELAQSDIARPTSHRPEQIVRGKGRRILTPRPTLPVLIFVEPSGKIVPPLRESRGGGETSRMMECIESTSGRRSGKMRRAWKRE